MSELKYWIWLGSLAGVRPRVKKLLLDSFGGARDVYFALGREYTDIEGITPAERAALENKELGTAERVQDICTDRGYGVLTLFDAAYPRRLANIYDPPAVIYTRGRFPVIDDEAAIAVVGTRSATPYGLKMAQRLGYGIVKCGGVVVSGLTHGIDAAGAMGALRAGGAPIGVLGTAIDTELGELGRDVELVGAIISEYPPGAEGRSSNFRERNRVTSGLTLGTVVVEAPDKSGALLFADEAMEQGREVFVVPSNADAEAGVGSNRLLKEGAKPVTDGWDILCEFAARFPNKLHAPGEETLSIPQEEIPEQREKKSPRKPEKGEDFLVLRAPSTKKEIDKPEELSYIDLKKVIDGLPERQGRVMLAITSPSMQVDDIIALCGLEASEVLAELTMLQLSGLVIQEPGKRFTRNI